MEVQNAAFVRADVHTTVNVPGVTCGHQSTSFENLVEEGFYDVSRNLCNGFQTEKVSWIGAMEALEEVLWGLGRMSVAVRKLEKSEKLIDSVLISSSQ